jgi:glycosyltransferase involved in cell wall biosynthesis
VGLALDGARELSRLLEIDLELILVDDGSSDETVARATALAPTGTRLLREPHRGKGAAVRRGVLAATGSRILFSDADWSVEPHEAMRLFDVQADLVMAVREGPSARRIGEPAWRHLLGRGFNHLVRACLLPEFQDSQCGCKLFHTPKARALFQEARIDGWAWDAEILTLALVGGLRIVEVPVSWRYEADTRLRPWCDGPAMALELARVRWNLARQGVARQRSSPSGRGGRSGTPEPGGRGSTR